MNNLCSLNNNSRLTRTALKKSSNRGKLDTTLTLISTWTIGSWNMRTFRYFNRMFRGTLEICGYSTSLKLLNPKLDLSICFFRTIQWVTRARKIKANASKSYLSAFFSKYQTLRQNRNWSAHLITQWRISNKLRHQFKTSVSNITNPKPLRHRLL